MRANDLSVERGNGYLDGLYATHKRDRGNGRTDDDRSPDDPAYQDDYCDAPDGKEARQKHARGDDAKRFLPLIWAKDASAVLDVPYIVKGVVAAGELAVIYGQPKSGKTFLAVDLALHVAAGREWFGHRVNRGLVIYIASEMGIRAMRRVRAWLDEKLGADADHTIAFVCVPQAVNLLDGMAVDRLVATIESLTAEYGKPALIVVDTLARSMVGGDENSAQDMGRAVAVGDLLRDRFGSATLIVHHEGKTAGNGTRGSSALLGAVDTMLHVEADDTGARVAELEWCRDGEAGERIGFKLRPVDLGMDIDGDHVSTCVIEPGEAPPVNASRKPARREVALDALREAISDHGEKMPGTSTIPQGAMAATLDQWKARWTLRTGYEDSGDRSIRTNFDKDRRELLTAGKIAISKPYVWIS